MKNKVNSINGLEVSQVPFLKGFLYFLIYGKEEHEDMEMARGKWSGSRGAGVQQDE